MRERIGTSVRASDQRPTLVKAVTKLENVQTCQMHVPCALHARYRTTI